MATKKNDIEIRAGITGAADINKTLKDLDANLTNLANDANKNDIGSKAFKNTSAAANEATKSIGLTRQEALALTYTFNDVTASLATGASPFTILAQQGGQLTQAFGGVTGTLTALLPYVLRLGPALAAGAFAAKGLFDAFSGIGKAKEAVVTLTDIGRSSREAGVSVREFQKFLSTASIAGADPKGLTAGLIKVNDAIRNMANARRGVKGAKDELSQFGRQFEWIRPSVLKTADVINMLQEKYASLLTQFQRDNFADKVEKTFGSDVAKYIATSRSEIDKFASSLTRLQKPLSSNDIAQAKAAQFTQALLDEANKLRDLQIGAAFIPALQEINKYLISTFSDNLPRIRSLANQIAEVFRVLNGDQLARGRNPTLAALIDSFTQAEAAARRLGASISSFVQDAYDRIGQLAVLINDTFGTKFNAATLTASGAIAILLSSLGPFGITIGIVGAAIVALIKYWPELSEAASSAADIISAKWETVKQFFSDLWTQVKQYSDDAWSYIKTSIETRIIDIQSFLSSLSWGDIWSGLVTSARAAFDEVFNIGAGIFDRLRNWAEEVFNSIKGAVFDAGSNVSGALGFASGGYVSGPGSATSDSIPAWLSNGEFVVKAAAVRRFGVDFFRRLNGMSVDPSALYGRYGFASGGLVSASIGAASGGSGGKTFNLVIDGRSFNGLSGSSNTINELEKYASIRQLSATAKRAPSRIG